MLLLKQEKVDPFGFTFIISTGAMLKLVFLTLKLHHSAMEVDNISQSMEAMSDFLKMAIQQSTELADKLIKMNAENTVGMGRW